MELLSSLSKATSNSLSELLKLPFELVIGMYNIYVEQQKKEEEEANSKTPGYNFSNSSIMSGNVASMARKYMPSGISLPSGFHI